MNSLLILSDQLSKNPEGNLTPKQTDFSKTIHSSGNDLLMLINDILDLSKIESGTVMVESSELQLEDLQSYVARTFKHVAESKNVDFLLHFSPDLPQFMVTDAKRLQQIIKNLLSNAFKFTHQGKVTLTVETAHEGWSTDNEDLKRASEVLAFSVADTGIGIAADKQRIIFEAFQQADGSTSRKYGGTGLGLAISRELSRLLGGEIRLVSRPGGGSTFTLYLPVTYSPRRKNVAGDAQVTRTIEQAKIPTKAPATEETNDNDVLDTIFSNPETGSLVNEVGDDRDFIQSDDRVLLIVENDLGFARFMMDTARTQGYKVLVTSLGAAALAMTQDYKPDAILLDIYLTDMQGWRVLERLKNDINTRHIPICIISTDESRNRALDSGALTFVTKPLQSSDLLGDLLGKISDFATKERKILVIGSEEGTRREIEDNIADGETKIITAKNLRAARKALKADDFDCIVAGTDMADVVEKIHDTKDAENSSHGALSTRTPIILYGSDDIDAEALAHIDEKSAIRRVHSPERLLDMVTLHLHQKVANMPQASRNKILDLHQSGKVLADKKVLVVDDDARNIFALSSVLEEHNMNILSADSGREAIRVLQDDPDVDIVLMDIMMPEMDGMETIREIRKISRLKNLPIVAVTAKAMKGDREKCIEAGAWDYLSKPVDIDQMMTVLRAWLHR